MTVFKRSPITSPTAEKAVKKWTALSVSEQFRFLFGVKKLLVATHREPIIYQEIPKDPHSSTSAHKLKYPAGGVSQSLHRLLLQTGGDWVSLQNSSGPSRLSISLPGYPAFYNLYRLNIPDSEVNTRYQSFANDLLWPLFHEEPSRISSRKGDYTAYESVNRIFSEAIFRVMEQHQHGVLWIHDYQLALVARFLRLIRNYVLPPIAFFWHIPWPNQKFLSHLPERKSLLEGLLDYDFLGFQTALYRDRFLESVSVEFHHDRNITLSQDIIYKNGRPIHVGDYPIGVDPGRFETLSLDQNGLEDAKLFLLDQGIGPEDQFLISVDRMDYTKGFLKRLQILESLFQQFPDLIGKLTLLQIAPPTRSTHPTYQGYQKKVREEILKTNARWRRNDWIPIRSIERTIEHRILAPLYRMAAGALVTSTNDGMNLVAKEYLAAQKHEGGTLFLSRFTGAAQGLKEAVLIDPYDPLLSAKTIHQALNEPIALRKGRNQILREQISRNNIFQWMGSILTGIYEWERLKQP